MGGMLERFGGLVSSAQAWLAHRPAYMLLTAGDAPLSAEPPRRFHRAWMELMGISLLWGVILVNLWGVAWSVFRDYEPLVMPAMATSGLFCLWPFRRGIAALADFLAPQEATTRSVAASAIVLVVALSFLGLKPDWHRWEFTRLPWWIAWLQPDAKLYRVLLLMPLWGAWSMLITVKFCRPDERTEPQVSAFARGCGAPAAAGCMAVLLGASIAYFHHLGVGSQVAIFAVTVLAAIGGGAGLSRAAGGPCRQVLLAANVLTQIAFILAYLAGR
jgi:hypothetical protein